MSHLAKRTWICLCRPSDVRNVAGALRAAANFDLAGLKLVTDDPALHSAEELEAFSSGASRVTRLEVYSNLPSALIGASLVVGTSRRQRNHSHLSHLHAHQMQTKLYDHAAPHILFGNERTGLSRGELDLCHALVEIHSCSTFPSLNLAHAVACVAYELARPNASPAHQSASPRAAPQLLKASTSSVEDEAFLRRVIEVSERVNYPPSKSPERFARQLRALLRRAHATPGDYGLVLGIFRELERLGARVDLPDSDTALSEATHADLSRHTTPQSVDDA